jgi:hypothetical protein
MDIRAPTHFFGLADDFVRAGKVREKTEHDVVDFQGYPT